MTISLNCSALLRAHLPLLLARLEDGRLIENHVVELCLVFTTVQNVASPAIQQLGLAYLLLII